MRIPCVVIYSCFLSLLTFPVHAAPAKAKPTKPIQQVFTLTAEGGVGYLDGEAHEYAYDYVYGSRYKLSELIWDLKELIMVGGTVSLHYKDKVSFNVGIWGALNEGDGQMEDYDWFLYEEGSPWTDYSLSSVDVTEAYKIDINATFPLHHYQAWTFKGIVGYKQDYWAWQDHGISYIYSSDPFSPDGFRDQVANVPPLTGIEYEQQFYIPYIGAGVNYKQGRYQFDAYFHYSPVVEAEDHDYHVFRGLTFDGEFSDGEYYGYGAKLTRAINDKLFASIAIDGQVIPEMEGDVTITADYEAGAVFVPGGGGLEHQSIMASVSLGYNF